MVELQYLSPQWVQSLKVSRGLLRRGLGIDVPQPSGVNLVTLSLSQTHIPSCLVSPMLASHPYLQCAHPLMKPYLTLASRICLLLAYKSLPTSLLVLTLQHTPAVYASMKRRYVHQDRTSYKTHISDKSNGGKARQRLTF